MNLNSPNSTAANEPKNSDMTTAARVRNLLIVLAAIALSVSVLLGLRTQAPSSSLTEMAKTSVPLETALTNGKPTFMEFYADWCGSCQAMASDLSTIKDKYAEPMNFVMLNVDNTKWLPEITKYRVDGIPHFVYLNDKGSRVAETIGEMPRSIMEANLEALIAGKPLPHAKATGQVSDFTPPTGPVKTSSSDPRTHGSQVQ
ncbi:thioredoxin family protein [Tychonema sp. LEGE 07199]|uniref:thioredoxin family protein n=1 Tax=unclassified Tychonema TaxID=2642144 RepID=UPI001880FAAB|nr:MULTISPECIES: thioredoxin family protein [unclassified Tychonema]MBE9119596.1 thioredoxin family protein [Tychonema sp. LEGE 07199]MBE9131800.1 thioredoxin family protein [Tychonema sp. LEGE 07196]